MEIYLVHPLHGTHIVYDSTQLELCLARGWKRRDDPPPPVAVAPVDEAPKPKRKYTRRAA